MTGKGASSVRHEFVQLLPEKLEEHTLYISVEYKAIVHLCLCGCGQKVVTPLSPTGWRMTFDGKTISLYPSVGNWRLACRSHYWIDGSQVRWSDEWSEAQIEAGFARDARLKQDYYRQQPASAPSGNTAPSEPSGAARQAPVKRGWWAALWEWLLGRPGER